MRISLAVALVLGLGSAFAALAPAPPAFGKDPAPEKAAEASIRWRRTYGEALREARLRNVPVLVSRHKDG